jgi:hypothetical protein
MRYSAALGGLAFTIIESAAAAVIIGVADGGYGIPEFLGITLVGHIF